MEIDHVVLAARSKVDAERVLSAAGLGIARGRVMTGLGLSNLVVPLRLGQILEIHYPNGEDATPGARRWPEGMPPLQAEHCRRPVGITRIDLSGPAGTTSPDSLDPVCPFAASASDRR